MCKPQHIEVLTVGLYLKLWTITTNTKIFWKYVFVWCICFVSRLYASFISYISPSRTRSFSAEIYRLMGCCLMGYLVYISVSGHLPFHQSIVNRCYLNSLLADKRISRFLQSKFRCYASGHSERRNQSQFIDVWFTAIHARWWNRFRQHL